MKNIAKPAIILVRPQMGENIGATARAMANSGFSELRIVAPRDGWPNGKAKDMASGAGWILEDAKIYNDTKAAISDLSSVFATTSRPRDMVKKVVTPRFASELLRQASLKMEKTGILFGAERTGLENEDVVFADAIISVPVSPDYQSLNLAQTVVLVCYEYFLREENHQEEKLDLGRSSPATREEIFGFFDHLESELDKVDFFKVQDKREKMLQNLRNFFIRANPTNQDIRTLRGVVREISAQKKHSTD